MRIWGIIGLAVCPSFAAGAELDGTTVFLEQADGTQIEVARLSGPREAYRMGLNDAVFTDHFLSMRPFRCIEGTDKTWCHVPYPYDIRRDISKDLTDLEYDFLFVWKGKGDYGINMWNGVYYQLEPDGDGFVGRMHEMDMETLGIPPAAGELRPIRDSDLEPADPESHWLPRLIVR